jgi:hypothetical protein
VAEDAEFCGGEKWGVIFHAGTFAVNFIYGKIYLVLREGL